MKDAEGRPLNVMPDPLVVPPALEAEGRILVNIDKFKDNEPNPYKGTASAVVDALLTDSTAWLLMDTTKPMKPLNY